MKLTPDLDSVSDWSLRVGNFASTNQTLPRLVTRHQYGISALVPRTSFRRKPSGGIAHEMSAVSSQATSFFMLYT